MSEKHKARMEERMARRNRDMPPRGPNNGGRGPRNPDTVAQRMIENFDISDDAELGPEELLKAIDRMHDKRRGGPRNWNGPQRNATENETE